MVLKPYDRATLEADSNKQKHPSGGRLQECVDPNQVHSISHQAQGEHAAKCSDSTADPTRELDSAKRDCCNRCERELRSNDGIARTNSTREHDAGARGEQTTGGIRCNDDLAIRYAVKRRIAWMCADCIEA
jgi:hypothetical protein